MRGEGVTLGWAGVVPPCHRPEPPGAHLERLHGPAGAALQLGGTGHLVLTLSVRP